MSKRVLSLKNKMDSFHLSFELKELIDSVDDDIIASPEKSVSSNGKRAWFGESKPKVINQIDSQLRKHFNIKESNRLVTCLHFPPEKDSSGKFLEKSITIKEHNPNVMHRVIISTVQDICEVCVNKSVPENLELKPWVAYKTPEMVGGMLSYNFKNDKNLVIPARKGFRQVRKTKKIDERHILIFDYMISKSELEELGNIISSVQEEKGSTFDTDDFKEAIQKLS